MKHLSLSPLIGLLSFWLARSVQAEQTSYGKLNANAVQLFSEGNTPSHRGSARNDQQILASGAKVCSAVFRFFAGRDGSSYFTFAE